MRPDELSFDDEQSMAFNIGEQKEKIVLSISDSLLAFDESLAPPPTNH